jgi:serine/threonine protein phosphatase PrpC
MIELVARGASDVGKKRTQNEDAIGVDEAAGIFVLADGMGGHADGVVASKTTVQTVYAELGKAKPIFDRFRDEPSDANRTAAFAALVSAVDKTCAVVYEMGGEGQKKRRMGATLDAIVRAGDRAFLAHVGDSRVILLRGGKVYRLTEDHTVVDEQLRAGIITQADADDSPFRGVLTRAIGTHRAVKSDTLLFDLFPGDILIMCSDGLHRYARSADLQRILGPDPEPANVSKLIAHANASGGEDNVSAIVITCRAAKEAPAPVPSVKPPANVASRIDAICKLPLFQHLSYREQVAVLSVAKSRIYEEGATIVTQGQPGDEMYIIIEGHLVVESNGMKIAELGPGGHFGEMALVDSSPRSATVRARTRTDVLAIGQTEINGLMRVEPVLGVKVLWNFVQVLSMRLREASREIAELQMENAAPESTLRTPFIE